ncbi:MAG TPA: lamin tail domain-containing protein [Phycisphaerales bacterium]|nr:lamin tail domain-containing protein [Phycisphaerales bacterium]
MKSVLAAIASCGLAVSAHAQVTISQLHIGSTVYQSDFVELFNAGNAPVSLNGWSIKIAFCGGCSQWNVAPLSGSIPAHGYFLVELAPASGSLPLPPPDATGLITGDPIGGKIMISNNQSGLISHCPSLDSTVDLVLWGEVLCEPAFPAGAMNGSDAIRRANGGCTDTGNDTNDFSNGTPTPRNSSSPTHSCTTGPDCNGNNIDDNIELQDPANDCNTNGQLDACEIVAQPSLDCDQNGMIDCTDLKRGTLTDVDADAQPDFCEGAVILTAASAAFVLNSGVSPDTTMWRVQGTGVEDVDGRPAPAYAAARFTNAAIVAALNSVYPNGWTIDRISLNMMRAVDPVSSSGSVLLRYTNADGVNLTPGNTGTRFNTFASNYPDALSVASWSFSSGAGADARTIYTAGGSNTPGAEAVFNEISSGAGTLTLLLSPGGSSVAAPYAGISHGSLVEPQLVIFASPVLGCGPQDFNQDGDSGTDQDIEAFFACLGGNCCPTCWHGGADFNGDGDTGTDQDIEAFFRVLGGGTC